MSSSAKYTSEEERAEATRLASEPSDEAREAPLRDEAHHHRDTVYVRAGEAGARGVREEQHGGGGGEQARGVRACARTHTHVCDIFSHRAMPRRAAYPCRGGR
jgi:hypothetical protein